MTTVMVVDDEPDLRFVTSMFLTRRGFSSVEASDGQEALEICQRPGSHIAMVITDQNMPRLTGTELRDRLRELYPHLPVHVWSCLPDAARRIEPKQPAKVGHLVDTLSPSSVD